MTSGRSAGIPPVRLADAADAETINDVRIAGWQSAYAGLVPAAYLDGLDPRADDERRRGYLRTPLSGVCNWVSEVEGEVRGWGASGPVRDVDLDPVAAHELWALYVAPDHWRAGHGTTLVRHVARDARARGFRSLVLWVLEGNANGRRFYEHERFRPDGAVKHLAVGGVELPELALDLTVR